MLAGLSSLLPGCRPTFCVEPVNVELRGWTTQCMKCYVGFMHESTDPQVVVSASVCAGCPMACRARSELPQRARGASQADIIVEPTCSWIQLKTLQLQQAQRQDSISHSSCCWNIELCCAADPYSLFFVELWLFNIVELRRLRDYKEPGSMGKQFFLGLEKGLGGSGDPAYPGLTAAVVTTYGSGCKACLSAPAGRQPCRPVYLLLVCHTPWTNLPDDIHGAVISIAAMKDS